MLPSVMSKLHLPGWIFVSGPVCGGSERPSSQFQAGVPYCVSAALWGALLGPGMIESSRLDGLVIALPVPRDEDDLVRRELVGLGVEFVDVGGKVVPARRRLVKQTERIDKDVVPFRAEGRGVLWGAGVGESDSC